MYFGGFWWGVVVVHKAYFLIFNNLIGPCQGKIFYFQNWKTREGEKGKAKKAKKQKETEKENTEKAEGSGGCALAHVLKYNYRFGPCQEKIF